MIFWISKLIASLFGFDITKVQKAVLLAVMILAAILIIVVCAFCYKKCGPKPASIDQKSIEKINKANEVERKAELQKVIEQNADVVKTVDERNTIAEMNEVERQAQIHAKIAEADQKIAAAKANGRDVTSAELECILVPASCSK